jgi:1-acyl-sn-glycerol-3-phosphate acyltransferase
MTDRSLLGPTRRPDGRRAPHPVRPDPRATGDAGEAFESPHDTLSLGEVLVALDASAGLPPVRAASAILARLGLARLRATLRNALRTRPLRETDPFGFEPAFLEALLPLARWVHDHYFRVESRGLEHIPDAGRVLLVANHSGTLPFDAAMVFAAVRFQHPAHRHVRALVEDFTYHLPWLGLFMSRVGAVRACQENALRLLEADEATLVFPEGVKGIGKLYRKRYVLQRFGRGGAIRLAAKAGAPIVPVAIVGAEEAMPLISRMSWLAGPLGLPYIPITPTLPWLGLAGLIPYPTKWFIDFGEPLALGDGDPEALVNDRVRVNRLNEELRARVQALVDARLAERRSVFFG